MTSEFHQLLVERGDTGGAVPRGPTHLMPPTTVCDARGIISGAQ